MKKLMLLLILVLVFLIGCSTNFSDCIKYCADTEECSISIMDSSIVCEDKTKTDIVKKECFERCLNERK